MEEGKDKYKLLRDKEGHIIFHGDEEHREHEIDVDSDDSIPDLWEFVKGLKKRRKIMYVDEED